MNENTETENNGEGIQEDSIETLEQEYKQVFTSLKTAYQAFTTEYIKTLDSKKSAIAAGYSKNSAYKQGSRLCRNKHIALLIALQQRINSLRGKVSVAWVLEQLKVRYEACVLDKREQAATSNLNLIGQHLGMFGKGDKGKGDLYLSQHNKYVNYPPVPDSIEAWVDQMRQVGYDAALPVDKEDTDGTDMDTTQIKHVPSERVLDTLQGEEQGITPIGRANRHA